VHFGTVVAQSGVEEDGGFDVLSVADGGHVDVEVQGVLGEGIDAEGQRSAE
jgi:hypothetical protein